MKGKKLTIIGIALSMSLALSTQTAMALELGDKTDLANNVQEQNDKSSKTFSVEKSVQKTLDIVKQPYKYLAPKVGSGNPADATTGATYYRKANWENKIKDKSRWPIGDNQRLVRVSTSDPLEMNDVNYDGAFIDANGRTVLRLIYREKAQAVSAVWYRALFNFGDLDQYIDYDKSYVVGRDGETKYDLKPFNDRKERLLDIGRATGDRTNQRKNLPINLVLKEGLRTKDLGDRNYIVQMRITNGDDATKIYAYAPGKSSMDYSSYTKSTSVSLSDKVDSLFVKGGQQSDSENATNQEFFMSEFIANPENYADASNVGIIRTQYMGQRSGGDKSPTVGGEQIAFVQVFDAKLVDFFKVEDDGTIAYTNLLNDDRSVSKFAHKIKIKKSDINYSTDGKLAYIVLAPKAFQKDGVKKVEITDHDQYTMLQGFYFTAIDYLVDKTKFADNFAGTNKLDYSMMSGWMNPNLKGWTVFEKEYENDYKVPEGESYLIDVGTKPASNQIMIQIGDETRAIYRKPQGYYNGYVTNKNGIDKIDEFAKGVYKFTLREGATIEKGQKLRILVPYVGDHPDTVNFLEAQDGTDYNKGAAQLRLQKDRNINMHLYTDLPGGATFKLRYTLKGQTEEKELVFTKPNLAGGLWKYSDKDRVLTGIPNRSSTSTGGNFYIDTTKLEKGKDIFVDAYDEKGNKLEDKTSYFRYSKVNKVSVHKDMTWVDHADTSSILSINKSLYTPYQVLFTNDYKDGNDDFYVDPKVLPASNDDFKKDTTSFVGYTKYDGGKVRTLYEEGKTGKLYAKVEAAEDEYTDKGELKTDNSKKITIPKDHIFDAQFAGDNKEYRAYEYKVDLTKMLPYHSEDKTEKPLTLLKDMKFVSNASDGSSLPSDLYETRVRARVLFDANTGKLTEDGKQVDKVVKIAPDNVKFYGEDGYAANGFEGANVEANTGDKFPEAPKLEGKNFLGWVTEEGKKALGDKAVVAADAFAKLSKDQIFTNETPVTKHLVVYAIYSEDVAVTFDANQGKFADDKDTTTVKTEGGNVTKPVDPTRDGYTFKGWAATKDATEADANILKNVTAPKTVYAVWEKNADAELTLNNPAKTPVGDLTSLTSGEKDAVIAAIIKANPDAGLTPADIQVANDGTATVSKDGKTKEFKPADTVEQKEVQNNFNPPKEPVLVENTSKLTPDEKQAVKDAVKAANPDRNLTDDDIKVADDGTVNINQNGKVGTIPAEKTVKAKDSVLTLADPAVTEVKDINNLTEEEKDAVKKAVIAKNSGLTENDITVDSKGNVSVKTSDGKTGEIPAAKTVKEKDLSKLKNPAVTPVADDKNLTENEKQAVKDAIKAANKDYDLQDNEIAVDDNGKATVTRGDSTKVFEPAETVKKDAKLLDVKAPKKTEVANINDLTEPEQEAVEAAIIAANPDLKLTKEEVVINDDGSAVITRGDKKYALAQKDNVVEKLKYPKITEVANPTALTENEKADVERAVRKANPNLPEGTKIEVAANGEVTVTYPESDGRPAATIPAKNTVVKTETKDKTAPAAPTVEAKDDGSVTVTPPKDVDVKSMDITYTPEGSDKPVTVKATKDDYGNWSLPADSGLKIDPASGVVTIPADKVKDGTDVTAKAKDGSNNESDAGKDTAKQPAAQGTLVAPAEPVEVKDPSKLTDEEKGKVEDAVKKANPDLPKDAKITVGNDGSVTVTDKDGNEIGKLTPKQTVKKAAAVVAPAEPVEVKDPSKLTDEEKGKVEDAVKKANPDLPKDAKITVGNDGSVTVTDKDGNEIGKLTPKQTVKKAAAVVAPAEPVEVKDPSKLTDEEKGKVEDAVKKANPDLPKDAKITVGNDGSVTVTDKDGNEIGKLTPKQTVKKAAAVVAPAEPVEVKDPSKLTDEEKGKVEDAVKKANPDLPKDAKITVGNDGSVTVTDKDGNEIGKLTPKQTVKKAAAVVAPAEPVEVKDPSKLTDEEKGKVEDAVKKANPDLPKDAKITVGNDGSVTVTDKDGNEIGKLTPKQTVKKAAAVVAPAEPVEVKDPSKLTDEEKGKVEDAVKKANPDLPKDAKITVGNDGSVTVTDKDGNEIGKLTPKQTVKKAAAVVAPAEPVEVKDPSKLTDEEKGKVEDAVKKANPDLPKDAKITVGNDGSVTVTDKDGNEIGKLTPKQTVKKAAAVVAPAEPVEVKDPSKLTDEEKGKVEDAVKKANPDLPKDAKITVGNDGSVTVTDKDGNEIGKLTPKQTVKKAGAVVAPAEPVEVKDPSKLTDEEKGKVEDAVKKANPDLPKDAKITVGNDGSVTVTDKDGNEIGKLTPKQTVKKAAAVVAPAEPVEVKDPSKLTDEEKGKVEDAVKKANPDLPKDAKITVGNDGSVTVTDKDGNEIGKLTPKQTVKKAAAVVAPAEPVEVKDPSKLTDEEKGKVEDAVKKANPDLPKDAKITVGNDGSVTVTDKDGNEIGKLTPKQTVKKAAAVVAPAEPVEVKDPSKLTDEEKGKVEDAVKKANPDLPKDAKITVGNDGSVTVTDKDGNEIGKLTPKQTVKKAAAVVAPAEPVEVKDPSKLTDEEKGKVEDAVKKANPDLPKDAKITVGNDGSVTVTDKDGNEIGKLTPKQTVKKAAAVVAPAEPVEVKDPSKLTDEEKGKVEDAVKKANPDLPKDAKITVGNDGSVTVTDKDGNEIGKLTPKQTVKKAAAVVAPAEPVEVKDPSKLTDEEKGKVEDAVKKANPDLPKDAKITVGNDGSVTVTDKDGKEIGKLTPDKTVKKAGAGSQGNVDKSKPSNQKGDKGVNTGDESRTGILATFFASIIALFAIKRRKKDTK